MSKIGTPEENQEIKAAFAARLRELRAERKLTREALAEASGVTYRSIEVYETGGSLPGWLAVLSLSRALGVTPDAFLPAP